MNFSFFLTKMGLLPSTNNIEIYHNYFSDFLIGFKDFVQDFLKEVRYSFFISSTQPNNLEKKYFFIPSPTLQWWRSSKGFSVVSRHLEHSYCSLQLECSLESTDDIYFESRDTCCHSLYVKDSATAVETLQVVQRTTSQATPILCWNTINLLI